MADETFEKEKIRRMKKEAEEEAREEERKARHEAIFGKRAVLPERGTGLGPLGFGILPNIQKRIQEIIKK